MERRAKELPESAWKRLARPPRYEVETTERHKPDNVKEQIVRARGYKNLVLKYEDVAEFTYRPTCCKRDYRVVVLRKKISVEKGQEQLFEQYRYFFYITNESRPAGRGNRLRNQRPLRSGKPDRATEERREGDAQPAG